MNNIEHILRIAGNDLPAKGVRVLLIGGFAVNHYGYSRNTLDMDFMVMETNQRIVRDVMTQNGFVNRSETDNVVFYQHPAGGIRVDFLNVDAATFDGLMRTAETVSLCDTQLPVPSLRNLIGMKLFALSHNAPARWDKDLPDIAYLFLLNNLNMREDIEPLCRQYGNNELLQEISRRVERIRRE